MYVVALAGRQGKEKTRISNCRSYLRAFNMRTQKAVANKEANVFCIQNDIWACMFDGIGAYTFLSYASVFLQLCIFTFWYVGMLT